MKNDDNRPSVWIELAMFFAGFVLGFFAGAAYALNLWLSHSFAMLDLISRLQR